MHTRNAPQPVVLIHCAAASAPWFCNGRDIQMAVCLPGEEEMQVPPLAVQSHSHFMAGELAVCAGAVPSW